MKRRVLSVMPAVVIVLTSVDITAFAQQVNDVNSVILAEDKLQTTIASGQCGDSLMWTLEGDTLTISGTGEMWDYSETWSVGSPYLSTAPWAEYNNTVKELVIEEGITAIGDSAFTGCSSFKGNLIIPDSVVTIGERAFYDCSGFSGNLMISDSVVTIGERAFYGCSGLTGDLIIPDSVTWIGEYAFKGCSGLIGNLVIPNSVTMIDSSVFIDCNGFTSVIISDSVKSLGYFAFDHCNGLNNIFFQGDAPNIYGYAFGYVIANGYYPSWKSGWDGVIENSYGGTLTWIPYEEGSEPWKMNDSETAPAIWFTFETGQEPEYSKGIGYNYSEFNMNIAALCMIPIDNSDPTYENVTVTVELPEGLSFSPDTEQRTMENNLGTMSLSGTKRQNMSLTVYIDETFITDEFSVDIELTADGYETPQTNTYKIPVSIVVEQAETTIIDTVERYTSAKEVQEALDIYNNSSSNEELCQRLFEYYNYDNMLDVRERLVELSDMHDERWDYEGLICDDMYLSWQYYDYLNNTLKGIAARAALYASGLAFNDELDAWVNPSTYLEGDYPGVAKYKSMLEEFIQKESESIELYSYIKETRKFVESSVGIWTDVEKGEFIAWMENQPGSLEECKTYFNNFVAYKKSSFDGGVEKTLVFDGEKPKFIKALGITGKVFKITDITVESIEEFVDVSSNLEMYETYHKFLQEVWEASDLPWELVVAAYQLDKEMEAGYLTPIMNLINTIRDECLSKVLKMSGISKYLGEGNEYLAAIKFTAFCINQFVDVGKMVVNSCHTEGYAFLAIHYKNKLEQCKQQFLAEKTEENAWAFYEAYVMLWKLRIAGEQKFLKMSKLEGGTVVDGLSKVVTGGTIAGMISELCGYSDKEAAVNNNLQMLAGFAFKYSIKDEDLPDEYQYLQKIIVECPVSVEILTDDGALVCVLNDREETEIVNEHGTFLSFYRATTGDYVKIAYFNTDAPYIIRAAGQETGTVDYSIAKTIDHQTYTVEGFDKVNVSENDVIWITTNEETYTIDKDGDGTIDIEGEQADKSKIYVQFDYQDGKQIRVEYADENGMVTMPELPVREGYRFKGWFMDHDDEEEEFTADMAVNKSITVYAKWVSSAVTEIFRDVSKGQWYADAIQYVYDKAIMEGNDDKFTPNGKMTRAMFVTTLYRLAGEPEITDYSALEELKDVSEGAWYTDAVCWAYSTKVTTGYESDRTFRMNTALTREQLATFLYRYAENQELDIAQTDDLSGLLNADKVKAYALNEMKWAVGAGLVSGLESKDENGVTVYDLAPQGNATRAQMASILMRFCEAYHI